MSRLIRSRQAIEDIVEISAVISEANHSAAEQLVDRFDDVFRRLAAHPQLGERSPSIGDRDVRFFPVGNYVVYYQAFSDRVWILRVWHAARGTPPTL